MNWKLPDVLQKSVEFLKPGAKGNTEEEAHEDVIREDEDDLGITHVQHKGTVPYRRVESAVRNFVDVALPVDLDRLDRHISNINKWRRLKDTEKLKLEYVNAGSTVKQLRRNLTEMEALRARVLERDLHLFDKHIIPARDKAMGSVQEFLKLKTNESPADDTHSFRPFDSLENDIPDSSSYNLNPFIPDDYHPLCNQTSSSGYVEMRGNQLVIGSNPDPSFKRTKPGSSDNFVPEIQELNHDNASLQTQLVVENRNSDMEENWEKLQKDIIELHDIMKQFSTVVHDQGKIVDDISNNVETAGENIKEGTSQLKKATVVKAAMFPLVGAVVGGAIGGPIGMLAGVKLGSVTAGLAAAGVTGSVLGYQGGKVLKKRRDDANSIEMTEIRKDSDSDDSFEFLEHGSS